MERTVHTVQDRQAWLERRKLNVNASECAALFHSHPFITALELWNYHTGQLERSDLDSFAMRRGRILEPAVAAALREEHPEWIIEPAGQYIELPDAALGATPDFYAWPSKEDYGLFRNRFLIQAKTVLQEVYEAEWTPAPPAHYLIQIQTEMLVTGVNKLVLAPMVLDGREFPVHEWTFQADEEFQQQILTAVRRFWAHVDRGLEPKVKAGQDADTLFRMFPMGEPEPVLSLDGDGAFVAACQEYQEVKAQLKELEARKDALSTVFMDKLRNHSKATAQDFNINWTTVPAMTVVQERKAHRRLTVNRVKRK
jgi:predicted phage-related endonuclease